MDWAKNLFTKNNNPNPREVCFHYYEHCNPFYRGNRSADDDVKAACSDAYYACIDKYKKFNESKEIKNN